MVQPALAAPPNGDSREKSSSAAQREHPERQGVDAREGHVRGADLERHDVVREAGRSWASRTGRSSSMACMLKSWLYDLRVHELEAGHRQLGADAAARSMPPSRKNAKAVAMYIDADLLVVGRRQPLVAPDAPAAGRGARAGSVVVAIADASSLGHLEACRSSVRVDARSRSCSRRPAAAGAW